MTGDSTIIHLVKLHPIDCMHYTGSIAMVTMSNEPACNLQLDV